MIKWHKHHLIPQHAGGSDDPSNLLKCNVAMHAFLHQQRYKETGDEFDRIAWLGLASAVGKDEIHHLIQQENGRRTGVTNKGKRRTDEQRKYIATATSSAMKGKGMGASNSQARAVVTHDGEFSSIADAARHFGLKYSTAKDRVYNNTYGWRYIQ